MRICGMWCLYGYGERDLAVRLELWKLCTWGEGRRWKIPSVEISYYNTRDYQGRFH